MKKLRPLGSKLLQVPIFLCLLASCHSTRVITSSKINLMPDFCTPGLNPNQGDKPVIYTNTDSLLKKEFRENGEMSKRNILVANATGSLDPWHRIFGLTGDSAKKKKDYLLYATEIDKNLALVRSEVDYVYSELDCEALRCRQLAVFLSNLNNKRNSKLTVAAIIAGSATTITPIFITKTTPQNIVLISGGIVSAGLGLLTLNPQGKRIKLVTANNMLTDIWYEKKSSSVYPPSIWYMLNEPGFSNLGLVSKNTLIRLRWTNFELDNTVDKPTEELLFGDGGLFDQESLETRATMLTEVMSHVNSIKKDLDNFSYDLNKLKIKILENWDW